jgi:flagellar hook-basal body complex protein FliE
MATKKKARRTVMYSSSGKKLYAVRDKTGKFKDIQQYSRAHRMDMARKSKDETASGASPVKKAAKKAVKKVAAKKTAARKAAKKAAGKVRTAVRRVVKAAKKATKKK